MFCRPGVENGKPKEKNSKRMKKNYVKWSMVWVSVVKVLYIA